MFEKIPQIVAKAEVVSHIGKIENVVGMSIEASGGRSGIGDIVMIYNEEQNCQVPAEVVGFKDGKIQLMTYEATSGITSGSFVRNTRRRLKVPVGNFLRGRIINAMGEPMDGKEEFHPTEFYTVNSSYTNPLSRPPIRERLEFGVKAIDGLNTIGKGQRIGIFAGSGVGKSTLMGMIAKNVKADINVIALVGERGREVLEFVQKDLGEEGMNRSVLVVATSARYAAYEMSSGCHYDCGIFQGSGERCTFDDGFPDTLCHGPEGGWTCHWGTAHCKGIYSFHLCRASKTSGAEREF